MGAPGTTTARCDTMAVTPINSEDRLVQATFAKHLERVLGWDNDLCLERGDVRA